MSTFWDSNGTKILGALTAMLGTLSSLLSMGAFNELLTKPAIGWLSIFVSLATAGVGGTTMARGFNNSGQVKVAAAMEKAFMATPPQQGFARPLMLAFLLTIAAPVFMTLQGCALQQALQPLPTMSFDQRLSVAGDQISAFYRSIAANVNAGRMSGADGQEAIGIADRAKTALDLARSATDIATAEGQLKLATNAIRELQAYLDKRGAR